MSRRLGGTVLVAVSATGFGTLALFGRLAFAAGIDTFTLMFLRFTLATVLLLALLLARRERFPRGSALLRLIAMGALGYVGQAFAYLTALRYASAGLVALLLYLYPVFVAILAALFLHERFTSRKGVALGVALLGTALTVGPAGGQLLGVLLTLASALIYSVYIITGAKVMKQVSAVQSSLVIFASAGLASGLLMLVNGPSFPTSGAGWSAIVAIVLFATVVPVVTFLAGIERIGPTNAAMLSTLEPVVTVLLAAVWLNEPISLVTAAGGALILVAVLLVTQGEASRARVVALREASIE